MIFKLRKKNICFFFVWQRIFLNIKILGTINAKCKILSRIQQIEFKIHGLKYIALHPSKNQPSKHCKFWSQYSHLCTMHCTEARRGRCFYQDKTKLKVSCQGCCASQLQDCIRQTLTQTKTPMYYHHHVLLAVIYMFTDSSLTQALINNVLHNKCDIKSLISSSKV